MPASMHPRRGPCPSGGKEASVSLGLLGGEGALGPLAHWAFWGVIPRLLHETKAQPAQGPPRPQAWRPAVSGGLPPLPGAPPCPGPSAACCSLAWAKSFQERRAIINSLSARSCRGPFWRRPRLLQTWSCFLSSLQCGGLAGSCERAASRRPGPWPPPCPVGTGPIP